MVEENIVLLYIPEEGGDVKPRDPSGWTLQELVENVSLKFGTNTGTTVSVHGILGVCFGS